MKMSKRALTNTSTNTITSSKEDSATFAAKNKDENAAQYLSFLDGGYIHGAEWGRTFRVFFCVSRLSVHSDGLFVLLDLTNIIKLESGEKKS